MSDSSPRTRPHPHVSCSSCPARSAYPAPAYPAPTSPRSHTKKPRPAFLSGRLVALVASLFAAAACGPEEGSDVAGEPAGAENGGAAVRGGSGALADSVVRAWTDAAGGLDAWESVRSARYTVTTVWYDSAGRIRRMRPRRVELRKTPEGEQARIERPEAEGLYVQAFDGDTAWATLNGIPLPPDHPAAAEAEYVARDVFYWFGLPYKLWDPGVNRVARRLTEGGVEVRVTFGEAVGIHPGDRYFYYFLDGDPFPEEVHYMEEGSESRSRTEWSAFGEAGPLTYVGRRLYRSEDGRPTLELRIDDVQIGPDLSDTLFAPPAAAGGSRDTARPRS